MVARHHMIKNLYIISDGGVALYSKNFAPSAVDEQLISGFLLAIGNFAKETVGSGLKRIEMRTGEQLHVFYDDSAKLTAAAIADAQDHPKLMMEILHEITTQFNNMVQNTKKPEYEISESPEFDSFVIGLLRESTAKRDKKRFFLALILGALLVGVAFYLGTPYLIRSIEEFFSKIHALGNPYSSIAIFGVFSLQLEFFLVLTFIPSSFLTGYIAGSRNRGKWIGVIFFFFSLGLSALIIPFNRIGALFFFMLIIYIPLVMVTSIALGYLGGLLRDRNKLYPLTSDEREIS
ncbi:MAG: hypothetical protein ACTSRL_18680 [Candidatus Helarchaeota archaeon]